MIIVARGLSEVCPRTCVQIHKPHASSLQRSSSGHQSSVINTEPSSERVRREQLGQLASWEMEQTDVEPREHDEVIPVKLGDENQLLEFHSCRSQKMQ